MAVDEMWVLSLRVCRTVPRRNPVNPGKSRTKFVRRPHRVLAPVDESRVGRFAAAGGPAQAQAALGSVGIGSLSAVAMSMRLAMLWTGRNSSMCGRIVRTPPASGLKPS